MTSLLLHVFTLATGLYAVLAATNIPIKLPIEREIVLHTAS